MAAESPDLTGPAGGSDPVERGRRRRRQEPRRERTARKADRQWAVAVGSCAAVVAVALVVLLVFGQGSPRILVPATIAAMVATFAAVLSTIMRARAAGDPAAVEDPRTDGRHDGPGR